MKDYRQTRQGVNQSLSEWETTFQRLVSLVNERTYANKRGLEQAGYFGRNPDMHQNNASTRLHNQTLNTPVKGVGSGVAERQNVGKMTEKRSGSAVGSAVGSVAGGQGGGVSDKHEEEDYISVSTSELTTPMTN